MRKKERNFRWKHAALAVMLGTVFCFTGCGSKDDNPAEETVKAETTKDDSAKDNTAQQETPDSTETAKAENTPTEAPESTPTETPATPTPKPGIEFPYVVDEERLVIETLFQLTSINPDCNDETGENVASVQVMNESGEYLKTADITVLLHDKTEFKFHIEDVPAGKMVLAFDTQNQVYDKTSEVKEITAKAEYSKEVTLLEDQISVTQDEEGLRLENISGNDLQNLTVTYHCLFEEMYYGGCSYEKTIDALASGESVSVDTSEFYLGEAAVVSIEK